MLFWKCIFWTSSEMVHRCPPTPNHSLETPDFKVTVHTNTILFSWRRSRHKRRQRYNHCCLGDGIQSIFAALQIYHQDDLKKRMSRRTDAWQNGGFRKMDDLPFLTATNRLPSEMDFLPTTFSSSDPCCIQVRPPNISDDLRLLFCLILLLCYILKWLCLSPHTDVRAAFWKPCYSVI